MSASRAEAITQAIFALLADEDGPIEGVSVHRDLHGALSAGSLPAIVVETGDEPAPSHVAIGVKTRAVEVIVSVVARGASPYTEADAALLEAHDRIMADRSLGGLAIEIAESFTRRSRVDAEQQVGEIAKSYLVQYVTTEISLE